MVEINEYEILGRKTWRKEKTRKT